MQNIYLIDASSLFNGSNYLTIMMVIDLETHSVILETVKMWTFI